MSDILELTLKLKDLLSGGMQQAAATTQSASSRAVSAIHNVGNAAQADTRKMQAFSREGGVMERSMGRVAQAAMRPPGPPGSGLMGSVAKEASKAKAEVAEVEKKIKDVKKATVDLGGSKVGGMLGSIVGGNLIASGIERGLSAGKDFLMGSVQAAMQFGAQAKSFEVLTGSAGRGRELVGDLRHLKQTTIMGASVYKNAQTMMGFGIGDNEVIKDLKMIGDIAMGDQDRMAALTLAFSQTRAAGKLMGQDLLQYINAGFNPLGTMAEHWKEFGLKQKVTVGQLKDMMSEGKISSAAVTKAFEIATSKGGKFYDMMNQVGDTAFGQMQKMKGNWAAFQIDFGNAIMPVAQEFMNAGSSILHFLHISKTVPEQLQTEQLEVGSLVASITQLNQGNQLRGRMMDLLKAKYPDMFSNIDREKTSNSELLGILNKVNQSYSERIRLASFDLTKQVNNEEVSNLLGLATRAKMQADYMDTHKGSDKIVSSDAYKYLGIMDRFHMTQSGVKFNGLTTEPSGMRSFAEAALRLVQSLMGTNAKVDQDEHVEQLKQAIMKVSDITNHKTDTPAFWKGKMGKNYQTAASEIAWYNKARTQPDWYAQMAGHDMGLLNSLLSAPVTGTGDGKGGALIGGGDDTSNKITGGGRKTIIININKEMVAAGGVVIHAQGTQAGIDEMEHRFENMWLRMLNSSNAVAD